MSKERKKLIKKLDDVFSKYIRARDGGKCVLCGSDYILQAGHLITRRNYATRWDEDNVFAQCRSCNYTHVNHPEIYTSWYIGKYGAEAYQKLVAKSKLIVKFRDSDLEMLIEYYKNKLKEV